MMHTSCPVRVRALAALAVPVLALAAPQVAAQGTVGTQGFGYPTTQLSTRADATAGALGPVDAETPVNPAALARVGAAVLHAQYEPEFRTVQIGGATERTTFSRFPLVVGALPVGSRTVLGLSASTVLDRSFATTTRIEQTVADTVISTQQTRRSVGGITDVRAALARVLTPRFAVGVGLHGYTGENRVTVHFADDSAKFIDFEDSVRLNYGGLAVSVGADWRVARQLALAASYRRGGTLRLREDASDRVIGSGNVPDRISGGVMYEGIGGVTVGASAGWQGWSAMNSLSTNSVGGRDVLDVAVGADGRGPKVGAGSIALRAGVGWRQLPFPVPGAGDANELATTLGAGLPLAFGRATLDLSARRARRTAGDARETGWLFGVGVSVRP